MESDFFSHEIYRILVVRCLQLIGDRMLTLNFCTRISGETILDSHHPRRLSFPSLAAWHSSTAGALTQHLIDDLRWPSWHVSSPYSSLTVYYAIVELSTLTIVSHISTVHPKVVRNGTCGRDSFVSVFCFF